MEYNIKVLAALVPQAFCAVTDNVPETNPLAGISIVIEVPRFSKMLQPAGATQL